MARPTIAAIKSKIADKKAKQVVAAPARLTLAAVNAEIEKLGGKETLVKGKGYFYWIGGRADAAPQIWTSIYVAALNQMTLAQWLEDWKRNDDQYTKPTPDKETRKMAITHVQTLAAPAKKSTHDYAEEGKLISAAMKKLGYKIKAGDVEEWFEGTDDDNGDAMKMDNAVKKFMGEKTFEYYDSVARLPNALMAKLGLYKDAAEIKKMGGGINLMQNFDKPTAKKKTTATTAAPAQETASPATDFAKSLKKGVRVLVNLGNTKEPSYFLGAITKNNASKGSVNVLFDDGDVAEVRAIKSKVGIVGIAIDKVRKSEVPADQISKWLAGAAPATKTPAKPNELKKALDILGPDKGSKPAAFSVENASKVISSSNGWFAQKATGKVKAKFIKTYPNGTATALVFPTHVTFDYPQGEYDQVTDVSQIARCIKDLDKDMAALAKEANSAGQDTEVQDMYGQLVDKMTAILKAKKKYSPALDKAIDAYAKLPKSTSKAEKIKSLQAAIGLADSQLGVSKVFSPAEARKVIGAIPGWKASNVKNKASATFTKDYPNGVTATAYVFPQYVSFEYPQGENDHISDLSKIPAYIKQIDEDQAVTPDQGKALDALAKALKGWPNKVIQRDADEDNFLLRGFEDDDLPADVEPTADAIEAHAISIFKKMKSVDNFKKSKMYHGDNTYSFSAAGTVGYVYFDEDGVGMVRATPFQE
ncbi:hypothetical protein Peetri_00010 [Pseudomonas phage vB_PpuM-Peetri]